MHKSLLLLGIIFYGRDTPKNKFTAPKEGGGAYFSTLNNTPPVITPLHIKFSLIRQGGRVVWCWRARVKQFFHQQDCKNDRTFLASLIVVISTTANFTRSARPSSLLHNTRDLGVSPAKHAVQDPALAFLPPPNRCVISQKRITPQRERSTPNAPQILYVPLP